MYWCVQLHCYRTVSMNSFIHIEIVDLLEGFRMIFMPLASTLFTIEVQLSLQDNDGLALVRLLSAANRCIIDSENPWQG